MWLFVVALAGIAVMAAFYFGKQRQRADTEYVNRLFNPSDSSARRELLEKSLTRAEIGFIRNHDDDAEYCAGAAEQFMRRHVTIGVASNEEIFSAGLILFVICDVFRKRIQCDFEEAAKHAAKLFFESNLQGRDYGPYFRVLLENYRTAMRESAELMHWLEVYVMRVLDGPASDEATALLKSNFFALAQNCDKAAE